MNSIPPDIYERVFELALAIVNASEAGDDALSDSLCQTLPVYFDEQAGLGRSHPFLTEAMADYTDDSVEAIRISVLRVCFGFRVSDFGFRARSRSLCGAILKTGSYFCTSAKVTNIKAKPKKTIWHGYPT
jgi:hypothetical protein